MADFSSHSAADAANSAPQGATQRLSMDDATMWESLKQAIANSSGFQTWRLEQSQELTGTSTNLDALVRRYLRETLETLAY